MLLLTLLTLPACGPAWDPSDFPGAKIRIEAAPEHQQWWHDSVEMVTTLWATKLEAYGCEAPFVFARGGEDAYPVTLIENEDWENPKTGGECYWNRIEVRHNDSAANTLAHEFGHAMGLEHFDTTKGSSIMHSHSGSNSMVIEEWDAMAAACMLGCGPCDTIDLYNRGF